ncbi:polysaccharide deacetylase family protein [Paenibacillus alba]|uniref:Polysaccharide deacetylase family protein n=1 Tax=Paenibacillus alba TaxID=1197127 RepID=A0ABU6G1J1_9BACL|nr:polysaccharide deacetylase family protein [Paenibacillus alba]MEC0226644.1 polysaccharide deacetylase family protein [Paenibacillus alba]
MKVQLLTKRKQHWMIGSAFCGMVGMALINFTVTGSVIPFPSKSPVISIQETHEEAAPTNTALIGPAASLIEVKPIEAEHSRQTAVAQAQTGRNGNLSQTKGSAASKQVAITFDDGPDGKYTPQVLDILKQNGVKATFFVVGSQVSKFPSVLKRIHEEGHAIGNHSWDHADLSKLSSVRIEQELNKTEDWIMKTIGISPSLVRAPYGAVSKPVKKAVEQSGRSLVSWDVDPRDWAGTSSTDIIQNIKTHTKDGGIILLHSFGGKKGNLDNTIEALPGIIAYLKKENFDIVTVPEMKAHVPIGR